MKHTQGPWIVGRSKDREVWSIIGPIKTDSLGYYKSGVIAAQSFGPTIEDSENNANLIAAAPEMLEELELIARFFSDHGAMKGEDSDPEKQILISIQNLIKKAKGEL